MAKMWPNDISPDTKSDAEKFIFKKIKDELNDSWSVIHSLPLSTVRGKPWAEIDFVLIGPPGIFCLEIKGGRIQYRIQDDRWIYINRFGKQSVKRESPFEQATKGMYGLREHLKNSPIGKQLPLVACGVMIPDSRFNVSHTDVIEKILHDSRHSLESMPDYLKRVREHWESVVSPKPEIDKRMADRVFRALRDDLEIVPSLSTNIGYVNQRQTILTDSQKQVIKGFAKQNRVLIEGNAGTGKTLCAAAEAKRLAKNGKKVLFTCYNNRLATVIKNDLKDYANIRVENIDALMVGLIKDVIKTVPPFATDNWRTEVPMLAFNSIAQLELEDSYDSIIIDEGQDLLHSNLFSYVLDPLLKGGIDNGSWRIFMDREQDIFMASQTHCLSELVAKVESRYELTVNCRNTKQIFDSTSQLCGMFSGDECRTEGPDTDLQFYKNNREATRELSRKLNILVSGGVKSNQIAVLSPKNLQNSVLVEGLEGTHLSLVSPRFDEKPETDQIGFYTIQSFKGLEADVVILIDLKELSTAQSKGYYYVGGSRATTLLNIFVHESDKEDYESNYKDWFEAAAVAQ